MTKYQNKEEDRVTRLWVNVCQVILNVNFNLQKLRRDLQSKEWVQYVVAKDIMIATFEIIAFKPWF